ncbi:hypothetical protein GCM10009661_50480 [Catellatospora chokoriensis]|uniref:Uncharacterized protein n=1 Tax=Catellatospora chokoriensis TaxID=310353 RepID=A0A8J3JVZ5_9ACTN|nr:hypothetical protein Cch02nite_15400 [Catellatospora chokoriensis]
MAAFIAAVGVVIAVGVFLATRDTPGRATPEAAVTEYVAALHAADRARLRLLAHPRSDATAEIDSRLARLGGPALTVTQWKITDTESDATKAVELSGTLDGAPYRTTIWLQDCDGRWCVSMGPSKDGTPKP